MNATMLIVRSGGHGALATTLTGCGGERPRVPTALMAGSEALTTTLTRAAASTVRRGR